MSLEKDFLDQLVDAITHDRLTLPTLPEVALRIREAVEDPEVSAATIAKVIGQDAALAARIMKVANSPMMRGSVVVDNLQLAISRMGIGFVRNLTTGLAMEQMFQATHDAIDGRLRNSWSNSIEVASICHVLASNFTPLKPDQATLAGLVHGIGILPILTLAEDNPAMLAKEAILDKIIFRLHGRVGQAILTAWEFPIELRAVPMGCTRMNRDLQQSADYVDVVTVAKLQSYPSDSSPYRDLDTATVPAFKKLGLSHEIDVHTVDKLAEELDIAKQALS